MTERRLGTAGGAEAEAEFPELELDEASSLDHSLRQASQDSLNSEP